MTRTPCLRRACSSTPGAARRLQRTISRGAMTGCVVAQPFPTEACCRAGQGLTQMRVALSGCVREPGTRALARRRSCAAHLQRLLPRDGPVASGVPPRARPCAKRAHRAPRPTLLFLPMRPFGGAKRGCRRNAAVLCVLQVPPCWTLLALPETAFGVLRGAALSVLQGCGSVQSCRFSIIADRQCHRSQALTLDHALRTAPSVSMKVEGHDLVRAK